MNNMKNWIIITFLISFAFLIPHFFMEITNEDYSPFWGSTNGDIIVNDETQGYGTRSKNIFRTGHFNSDSSIYENKEKMFIIELSPQVLIYAMSKIFTFDQIYSGK